MILVSKTDDKIVIDYELDEYAQWLHTVNIASGNDWYLDGRLETTDQNKHRATFKKIPSSRF